MVILIAVAALVGLGVIVWAVLTAHKIPPPPPRPKIEPLPIKVLNKKLNDAQIIKEALSKRDRRQNGRHPRASRPVPPTASPVAHRGNPSPDSDFSLVMAATSKED